MTEELTTVAEAIREEIRSVDPREGEAVARTAFVIGAALMQRHGMETADFMSTAGLEYNPVLWRWEPTT